MPKPQTQNDQRAGLAYGITAYGLWGLVPLFWPLLAPASAPEILAHRMVWSLAVVGIILLLMRRWAWLPELVRQPRRLALVAVAAAVISLNWGFFIWGVNSGHVVETSLGYFINPLVTILFGVLLLKERMRPLQWTAVGIGAAAVIVLTAGYGRLPWLALLLAFSFATYGLVKKKINLGGIESLAAETAVQFLPALAFLYFLSDRGASTFGTEGTAHAVLLAACGLVTAVPLVCFGAAAIRVPLSTIGLMQYLTPTSQFVLGIAYFHEKMPLERWLGFVLVWLALTLLTWDALHTARRGRAALRAAAAAETTADLLPDAAAGPVPEALTDAAQEATTGPASEETAADRSVRAQ
jgi:chloramphenicol-sensitive protein RarD